MCTDLPLKCQHLPSGRQAALKGPALAGAMWRSRRYSWAFGDSVSHLSLWCLVLSLEGPSSPVHLGHTAHMCRLDFLDGFVCYRVLFRSWLSKACFCQVRTIHPSRTSLRCFKLFMKPFFFYHIKLIFFPLGFLENFLQTFRTEEGSVILGR